MLRTHRLTCFILCLMLSFSVSSETQFWLKQVEASLLEGTPWGITAQKHGIDPWLLFAISLEESGKYDKNRSLLTPWPYVTHRNGSVVKHESLEAAISLVKQWESAGIKNYDVGPFQINRRWHGRHFANIEDMFDVAVSADYAAMLLAQMITRSKGDSLKGVGLYREWRGGEKAQDYSDRIRIIRTQLPGGLTACCE